MTNANSPNNLTKFAPLSPFLNRYWPYIGLFFVVLVSFAIHVNVLLSKTSIGYDESISYLVSTCHAQDKSERPFTGKVEPVSSWKQYVTEVRDPFCFAQITHDMAAYDIHPPLYFWLLHSWFVLVGVHFWSGTLLNSIIAVLVMLVLFGLAIKVLGHKGEALLVVFSFAFNPSVFLVSMEARPYELLALWTLIFVWLLFVFTDGRPRIPKRFYIALFLVVVAGLLTHFLFLLPLSAGFVFVAFRLWRDRTRLLSFTGLAITAFFCAWLLYPYLFASVGRVSSRSPEVTWMNLLIRVQRVGMSLASFYYVFIVLILLLVVALIYYWRKRTFQAVFAQMNWHGVSILFFPIWIGGAMIVQYLLFLTPTHAMGPAKYFSMVWPFLAFLPVFILRSVQYRRTVLLYFLLIPFIFALLLPLQKRFFRLADPSDKLADYSLFLIDSTERGVLFQLLWVFPDDSSVLIIPQEDLLADDGWVSFVEPSTLYLSDTATEEIALNRQEVLRRLTQVGFSTEVVPHIQTRSSGFDAVELSPP